MSQFDANPSPNSPSQPDTPDKPPSPGSSPDQAVSSLKSVRDAVAGEFPGAGARLQQFVDSINTTIMAVEHLFDEAERMPQAGYRKTPEQKAQEAADRQRMIDDLRKQGVSI